MFNMSFDAVKRGAVNMVNMVTPAVVHETVETDDEKAKRLKKCTATSGAQLVSIAGTVVGIALGALGIGLCAKGSGLVVVSVGMLSLVIGAPLTFFGYNASVMLGNIHKELETSKRYKALKETYTSPLDDSKRAALKKILLPDTMLMEPFFNFSADLITSQILQDQTAHQNR